MFFISRDRKIKIMYKRLVFLILLLVPACDAIAVDYTYNKWDDGDVGDHFWSSPLNWDQDRVPIRQPWSDGSTYNDYAFINYTASSPNGCVHQSGDHIIHSIWIARYGSNSAPAILTMNGGSITNWWIFSLGRDNETGNHAIFNMNAGTITVAGAGGLEVGYDSKATINMIGGTINTTKLKVSDTTYTPAAEINLDGGTINCNSFVLNSPGLIDIADGTLIIDSDVTSTINTLAQNSRIIAHGSRGEINVSYSSNKTMVTATSNDAIAWNPSPRGTEVPPQTTLTWSPGDYADKHNVYFGTSEVSLTLVTEPTQPQEANSYNPGTLEFDQTYFWRVDEVNESTSQIWTGNLWSFTVINEPQVIVDFSDEQGPATYRASGFLHSISSTSPEPNLVNPLKPQTFRMSPTREYGDTENAFNSYERIHNDIDARIQASLMASFRDTIGGWPGDNGDWGPWENFIEDIVNDANEAGYIFQWDIWNEANLDNWWNPTGDKKARFFETWERAWRKIKSIDPNAEIVGPSTSGYANALFTVEEFLTFADTNSVLPDILSWHSCNVDDITADVTQVRSFMANNGITIDRINLGEMVGPTQVTSPGMHVWYFATLEDILIYSACHACWMEDDLSPCWNTSLDGLLTLIDKQPRASWWVYKAYADITGNLVSVLGDNDVEGVAGKGPDNQQETVLSRPRAQVLLGKRSGMTNNIYVMLTALEDVAYLKDASDMVRIVIEHIPDSGYDPLPAPTLISDTNVPYADTIYVTLPDFGPTDAYVITITNPNIYRADINNFSLLASHWLEDNSEPQGCLEYPIGDLDQNCKVNFIDFSLLSLYWCGN